MAAKRNRNTRVFRPTQLELSEAAPADQPETEIAAPASELPGEEREAAAVTVAKNADVASERPALSEDAILAAPAPGGPVTPVAAVAPEISSAASAAPPAPAPVERRSMGFGNPGALELALFCRQFATLIEAGISVPKTLQMLASRVANGRLRQAVEATARGVEAGAPVHEAMAPHARIFTPQVIEIVRAGETAGKLEGALARLAEIMEGKARIRSRIRAAAFYPLVSLAVAAGVLVSILVMAIPRFAAVYGGKETLPAPTQFVIELSEFFIGAWGVLLVGVAGAAVGLRWWFGSTPGGRRAWSWIALHMPVLRGLSRKIGVARSARTLGGLMGAGIPLIEALKITVETSDNALIADTFQSAREQVEKGGRMAGPLDQAGIFPPLAVDMIATGEETGALDRMLIKVADVYDVEVESTLSGLSSVIEPLLIALLGGVVILIALAVLLPYFRLAGRIES